MKRFPEAHTALEEAHLAEPHYKDIIRELADVSQSLAINKNGKRVIVASLDATESRARKMLVSPLQGQDIGPPLHCHDADMVEMKADAVGCVPLHLNSACVLSASSEAHMSSETSVLSDETLTDSEVNQFPFPTDSTSTKLRFSNKKRSHTALHLSTQDYANLLHGKNLGFYLPRSMSFMRVRTLTSKTIQTGTPHEDIHGTAEVPTSSPSPEILVKPSDVEQNESVELVKEEAILQVDKKIRLNSFSSYATKISFVHFKFGAVRDHSLSTQRRKERRNLFCRAKGQKQHVSASSRTSLLTSAKISSCFCRFTRNATTITRMKRKDAHFIEFDAHYHPPFKKCRLLSSVVTKCSISSVSWVSSRFGVASTPLFVL